MLKWVGIFDLGELKKMFMRKIWEYRVYKICEHDKNVPQLRIRILWVDYNNIRPFFHSRNVLCVDG